MIEKFKNVPVMVQLKNPVLGAISSQEVELEDGTKCGSAMIAFFEGENQQRQPQVLQVLRGEVEDFDDTHVVIGTLGADNVTPIRCCVEISNIANITFCVEHHAPQEPSKIIS